LVNGKYKKGVGFNGTKKASEFSEAD